MIQNGKRIYWVYTFLLFHAAVPDRTLSSKIVTAVQATVKASLESKAAPSRWFQRWTMHSGQVVPGEFATVPGAFKYSASIEVDGLRCSGAVIASKWVLTSTHCFSTNRTVGFAYAGGIKYSSKADKETDGVQQQRLMQLLLYTETQTESDLRLHDIMLAQVGPLGFRFNELVQPIRFTDQRRFSLSQPRTCVVVGYGDDNFETITLASLLKECTEKTEADNSVCVNEFRWPCIGDAGAPLVCQNMLVGTLRSEGLLPNDKCTNQAEHTAKNFTFVGYYRDWIGEHVAVQFGVWRNGSVGYGAPYPAVLLLCYWMYMYLK